ncbi:hypothetical protein CEXT_337651 [Caerostris extrusa]|uniref:Uncharacterized protein n=1 Tax=Caerostris extrusa TaxID=172846 RepID=A0AAV4QLG7_CAEEX|nr:hypothetical protein CEXT_337651 [Caerostris extrusa]
METAHHCLWVFKTLRNTSYANEAIKNLKRPLEHLLVTLLNPHKELGLQAAVVRPARSFREGLPEIYGMFLLFRKKCLFAK